MNVFKFQIATGKERNYRYNALYVEVKVWKYPVRIMFYDHFSVPHSKWWLRYMYFGKIEERKCISFMVKFLWVAFGFKLKDM